MKWLCYAGSILSAIMVVNLAPSIYLISRGLVSGRVDDALYFSLKLGFCVALIIILSALSVYLFRRAGKLGGTEVASNVVLGIIGSVLGAAVVVIAMQLLGKGIPIIPLKDLLLALSPGILIGFLLGVFFSKILDFLASLLASFGMGPGRD